MEHVWVRLYNARYPIPGGMPGFAWAMWQPGYTATQWPHDELKPDFAYYICETLDDGTRAITHKARATHALPPTEAASPEDAYDLVAERMFDDGMRIAPDVWHDYHYNAVKAGSHWPQRVVAWRAETELIGPHVLEELRRFPRSGWLKSASIAL